MPAKPPASFRDREEAATVRVLLAGPEAMTRGSVARLLGVAHGVEVVGAAATDADTIRLARGTRPDVVLLDSANGLHVLATARRLRAEGDEAPIQVLLFGRHEREVDVLAALRSGIGGLVDKDSTPDELLRAVRMAAGGGMFVIAGKRQRPVERLDPSHLLRESLESISAAELVALSLLLLPDGTP
jgi:DNA-binding NarL/FixJ family response regulator